MMDFYDQSTRRLDDGAPKWQLIFMSVLMIVMFSFLISDRVAPDHVFVTALAFCMVTGIVDAKEGLKGFANEGVLTVMVRNELHTQILRISNPVSAHASASGYLSPPVMHLLNHHSVSIGAVCSCPRSNHDWCN